MDNEMINEDELCAACEAILFSMGDAVDAIHIEQALEVSNRDDRKYSYKTSWTI